MRGGLHRGPLRRCRQPCGRPGRPAPSRPPQPLRRFKRLRCLPWARLKAAPLRYGRDGRVGAGSQAGLALGAQAGASRGESRGAQAGKRRGQLVRTVTRAAVANK